MHRIFDLLGLSDISRDGQGRASERVNVRRAAIKRLGPAAEHGYARAAARKLDRSRTAHPGSAAGHQRNLALQQVGREAYLWKFSHHPPVFSLRLAGPELF
jgi:hypothetical protein